MASWQSAVVHPLGLAGYALAVVFGALAKFGPTDRYPWLAPVAVTMAVVALLGGLLLAGMGKRTAKGPASKPGDSLSVGTQSTQGDQSPAVVSKGPVSFNYGGEAPKKRKN